jgi:thiol-disulfide isomerase/thioredoxin
MKWFLAIWLMIFAWVEPRAQGIEKLKIAELQTYIRNCDHPLIVNFWATFCVPCLREIPYFQSTTLKYKDQRVELLLVSLDLADYYPAKIEAFVKKQAFSARVVWLDETNADYFCPLIDKSWSGAIPSSLFINNRTHFRKFYERQLTEAQTEENVRGMLAQP